MRLLEYVREIRTIGNIPCKLCGRILVPDKAFPREASRRHLHDFCNTSTSLNASVQDNVLKTVKLVVVCWYE